MITPVTTRLEFRGGFAGVLAPFALFLGGVTWLALAGAPDERGFWPILLAALDWAVYTLLLRGLDPALDRFGLLLVLVVLGIVFIAPWTAWEWLQGRSFAWSAGNLATFLYVGIFPSVLAYLFYNYGVQRVGASRAGSFIHLMPVFGSMLAAIFLGERFDWFHGLGIAGIFGGLLLSSYQRRGSTPVKAARQLS